MTAKKNVNQVMSAKITDEASAAAVLGAADAVVDMGTPAPRAAAVPTVEANVVALSQELAKRGGVTMVIKAGTDVLRNVNASNTGINTGSAQTLGQKHILNTQGLKVIPAASVSMDLGV